MPFVKGDSRVQNQRPNRGPNPTAGRPPDWLKSKCREIVEKNKLVEFLGDVATGEKVDIVTTDLGFTVTRVAPIRSRLDAIRDLVNRGWGMPNMTVEVSLHYAETLISEVLKALRQIPTTCPHCKTHTHLREKIGETLLELSRKLETAPPAARQ